MVRDDLGARLRAVRPGASSRHDPLPARALAEAERYDQLSRTITVRSSPTRPGRGATRRPVRAVLGAVAMAMVVLVAAFAVWANVSPEPATAITPPALSVRPFAGTAEATLSAAADAAARRDHDAPGAEPDAVRSHQWALESEVAEDGTVTSRASVPQQRTLSFAPDGSVAIVARAADAFPGEASAGLPSAGTLLDEQRYAPGRYENPYAGPPPTQASAVRRYLLHALGLPDLTTGDSVRAVGDLLSSRPVTALQESALLGFLSRRRGLVLAGTTTDRLGRAGTVLVAQDRKPGEYEDLLVVDPAVGRILSMETVYVGHDRTDIPSPATTLYVAWER